MVSVKHRLQIADCRPGSEMQTEGKMQTAARGKMHTTDYRHFKYI